MSKFSRRDFLKTTAGAAAAGGLGAGSAMWSQDAFAQSKWTPEKGAKLRLLRWKRFVQGDEDQWAANTKKFTEKTGVEVRSTRRVGRMCGPRPQVPRTSEAVPTSSSRPPRTRTLSREALDVSDVANYLGGKYGGWYPVGKDYCTHKGKWVAIRWVSPAPACASHKPHQGCGLRQRAEGQCRIPEALPGAEGEGHAGRFRARECDGRRQHLGPLARVVAWREDGRQEGQRRHQQPETIAALEYAKQLYETFVPGTLSWLDPNNNKAFLDGQISLTNNGISVYYAAKNSQDPKIKEMVSDIDHANSRSDPWQPTEWHLFFPQMIFKYTKFPNAAKAYLAFMMEKDIPEISYAHAQTDQAATHIFNSPLPDHFLHPPNTCLYSTSDRHDTLITHSHCCDTIDIPQMVCPQQNDTISVRI
jgi:multiple sugar transport system substrate-binding protein